MSDIPSFAFADLREERHILSVANLAREDRVSFFEIAARCGLSTVTETFPLAQTHIVLDRLGCGMLPSAAVLIPPRSQTGDGGHG